MPDIKAATPDEIVQLLAPLTPHRLRALLKVAGDACRSTTAILESERARRRPPISQQGRDVKLAADRLSETMIRSVLSRHSLYPIFGEEDGWAECAATGGPHWVVDPLDGSFNFFRGVPLYAVTVALCEGGGADRRSVLGAVYDPVHDELVTGGKAVGLFLNGEKVAPRADAPRHILATGYPARADQDAVTAGLRQATQDWLKIRMLGTAALSLAWVALGRLDGYAEQNVMWWDVAAGLALAEGAQLGVVSAIPRAGDAVDVRVEAPGPRA